MREDATTLPDAVRLHTRVSLGMRRPANWLELLRFGIVGASGSAVNLAVFALLTGTTGAGHRTAATAAFLVAVTNNFAWNRRWTFRAASGDARFQAPRFLAVSLAAFLFALGLLEVLIVAGLSEVAAQAVAIVCATPVNFLGNRLWSFRR